MWCTKVRALLEYQIDEPKPGSNGIKDFLSIPVRIEENSSAKYR